MQRLVAVVFSLLLLCPLSRAQFVQPGDVPSRMTWHELKIGAGGFLTGIDIAKDGTKVVRADTFGAYVWNSGLSKWI